MKQVFRVGVTGANGYVGRHLVRYLRARGCYVVALVRRREALDPAEVDEVRVIGDIDESTRWETALEGLHKIAHLAGMVHQHHVSADQEAQFFKVNQAGTTRLVGAARTAGVRHFLFLSSISVRSPVGGSRSVSETTPALGSTPYAASKKAAESEVMANAGPDMRWTIIEPPMVYGFRAPGNFQRLTKIIQRGIPLPLGSAREKRSFIHVENLCDAIWVGLSNPNAENQLFVVADGQAVSSAELIADISAALGRKSRLFRIPTSVLRFAGAMAGRRDDFDRLLDPLAIDCTKFIAATGWRPPLTYSTAIRKCFPASSTET